ncbi:hypothetical protein GIY09_08835 [Aerococcaceae bacterium WS4759]|uniref:Nitroreductase domain-containing protein n=1 Tax=Fundicoccus ignavus TaxID=2664442 RepID=A0A6I2GL16_9LACT|nr:nitroreductase family protein [Fundicoccus ignavus]MRI85969.1 hypothetical protein [Fundicoccus ignavus]
MDISSTIKRFEKLAVKCEKEYAGTFEVKNISDIDYGKLSFYDLTSKRHSIREFGQEQIDYEKIDDAIKNSILTPSACNRQPWKVYLIRNEEVIKGTIELQKGFKGNAPLLILVTVSQSYYGSPKERYAAYVDGGMFGMTLIYSLTAVGLATCTLNTTFDLERDKKIRNYLEIPDDEVFAMLIAVGNYPESAKIPISKRIDIEEVKKVVN